MPSWLRHELRDVVHEVLGPQRLKEAGFSALRPFAAMIRDHEDMRVDYSRNIWCLLVFMLWHDEYLRCPENKAFFIRNMSEIAEIIYSSAQGIKQP
jgi:Asparagine synthase